MTEMPRDITLVPPRLSMPDQDLKQPFHDPAAPDQLTPVHGVWLARIFLFLLPSFLTGTSHLVFFQTRPSTSLTRQVPA